MSCLKCTYIARRIHERLPRQVPFEDLVHAGVIGLMEAVRSLRSRAKSVPLQVLCEVPYSRRHTRQPARSGLGIAPRSATKGGRWKRPFRNLSKRLGRQPEEEEIAAELGISSEDLYALVRSCSTAPSWWASRWVRCIDQFREAGPHRVRAQVATRTPSSSACGRRPKRGWRKAIGTLSEKEQMVISLYYKEELTMKEIAAVMQLGESSDLAAPYPGAAETCARRCRTEALDQRHIDLS
jgi:RNA polymerase sigma factor for flagellar operon FliA